MLELFEGTSFSHRREHVDWIESAKRPKTRTHRIAATIDRLCA